MTEQRKQKKAPKTRNTEEMNSEISRLITIMRFPQIVLIVLRHNAGLLLDAIYGCGIITAGGIFVTGLGGIFAYSALLAHPKITGVLAGLSGFSFCIYLFHEPLLSVVRTIAISFAGGYTVLLYLVTGAVTILLCMAAGGALRKLCPGLYRILSGGR